MFEYLRRFLNIRYALNGIWLVLEEKNIRMYLVIGGVLSAALLLGHPSPIQITIFFSCFLMVIVLEMFNSALEGLADFTCGKQIDKRIGELKDIAAGAVFLVGFAGLIDWLVIMIY